MTVHQGSPFIDFTLGALDTRAARKEGPLFLVFWRTGCSTCRFALPFFDRIARAYPRAKVVGVSQDDAETTRAYCQEQGLGMEQAIDEGLGATRDYGLKTVPSYVLADATGTVLETGEGWDLRKIESIANRIAASVDQPPAPVVGDDENVPAFKPG